MTVLARVCVASAALAMIAGPAAAQNAAYGGLTGAQIGGYGGLTGAQIGGQSQPMIERDPNSFTDNSPGGPPEPAVECRDETSPGAQPPKVVRTMPAPGSVVRPGSMVLSVTFDQPMACKANLANGSPFPIPCPGDKAAVVFTPDRRTLTTVCEVEAGASYSMPIVDFVSAKGAKSGHYDLAFTTSNDAPVTDVNRALAQEKAGPVRR
jgi:hypothetical protein